MGRYHGAERGRAARLARGAHNPKVGSSNLPPATTILSNLSAELFKTIWSIRNLSKNSQVTYSKHLRRLAKGVDLNDHEAVERFILNLDCSNKTRNNYLMAYAHYCKANEIQWTRFNLKNEIFPVKVPTEEHINTIISSASPRFALIFHLSKHGLRPDEISKIRLRDFNGDKSELSVRTSKLGLERTLRIKRETSDLFRDQIALMQIMNLDFKLFPEPRTIQNQWRIARNRAYQKFKDTELLKIRLYDLRHWFGTTTYIKTRDLLFTKYVMGHRNLESTMHYMHISKGCMSYSDEYTVKVASTIEEFTALLESGFEYVSDYEVKKILRKRK